MKPAIHRPTVIQVNLDAIRRNIENFRKHIGEKKNIWAVLKADAYGHGAVRVSQAIEDIVDGFCVSNLDEGIELRKSDIGKPILVLSGIPPKDAILARDFDIVLTAPSLNWLKEVTQADKTVSGLKVHIKVDSGMGRIGVTTSDEANAMLSLADDYAIDVEGVFTHFSTADEVDTTYYELQIKRFNEIVAHLSRRPKYVHSTNSAAGLWHKDQVQDILRLGIAMYGLNPSGKSLQVPFRLEPALTLTSELTHVKVIQAGDSIGYGATFTADKSIVVGTVPIGYADGWTRQMQGSNVLVDGQFCEIIGRVSMDQLTIQLPKHYSLGTKVTLIGKNGKEEITAQDVADKRETIHHEVICLLSDRIPRFYKENKNR